MVSTPNKCANVNYPSVGGHIIGSYYYDYYYEYSMMHIHCSCYKRLQVVGVIKDCASEYRGLK